jgi:flagellin
MAATSLAETVSALQKSSLRMSSGSKVVEPRDDAGGLAVALKMQAASNRNSVVQNNVGNGLSLLQTQDGALKTTGKILDRMSELKMLNSDPTKNAADLGNYQTEFAALQTQLTNLKGETFNGVALFAAGDTTLSVKITEDGGKAVDLTQHDLAAGLTIGGTDITDAANTLDDVTIDNLRTAIQNVATMRAKNGAQSSQLDFANQMLVINKNNLDASISRIMDVDVATESTKLAKFGILAQAGTAMLAQANQSPQLALSLLR